jgi:hypothetical protein
MNSKHLTVIAILGGLAVGFFVKSLHQPTSTQPTGLTRATANLYLFGWKAAGGIATYY